MSVGLRLLARFDREWDSPEVALHNIKVWIENNYIDLRPETRIGFIDSYPTLFCLLHPAAEEVELSLIDLGHLQASANTSTVGPGYHIFLCSLLKRLAISFGASWQEEDEEEYSDETGYFTSGEEHRVFDAMTAWLSTLAEYVLREASKSSSAIALSLHMHEVFESDSPAMTPMGPRDSHWFEKTATDGSQGRDFFAWWNPGLNAEYFLNRALVQMWAQVRWRRPSNPSETAVLRYVAESLDVAYKLDPKLNFPWAEWAEILGYLDTSDPLVTSRVNGKSAIGYRRRDVQVSMPGGWWITVPVTFSEFRADEDHNYYAFDPPKEVWFTSYRFTDENGEAFKTARTEILSSEPELLYESDGYVSRAEITDKQQNGEKYYLLQSSNVTVGQRSVCTIVFTRPEERDWAIQVWKSIKPPSSSE